MMRKERREREKIIGIGSRSDARCCTKHLSAIHCNNIIIIKPFMECTSSIREY